MKPKFCVGQNVKVVDGQPETIGQTGVVQRITAAIDSGVDRYVYVVKYDVPFRKLKYDMFYEWKLAPNDDDDARKDIQDDSLMEVLSYG